jgi:methylated-DNA-[protein]-cysteine S-methyltransferase
MTVPSDLDRRFREAAVRASLLDAAYDVVDSPVGRLLVATTDRGVLRISFSERFEPDETLEDIARAVGPRVLRAASGVDEVHRELDEYFAGRRRAFDLPLDLRGQPSFTVAVLHELAEVPYGSTATYGELAARTGRPGAARAVGMVMNRNPIPIVLPCHRIVGASGKLVGYAGGLETKEHLLRLEGALLPSSSP